MFLSYNVTFQKKGHWCHPLYRITQERTLFLSLFILLLDHKPPVIFIKTAQVVV